jgi:hypothetical protein
MEMGWLWGNKEEKNRHTAGEGDVVARVAAVAPEKGVLRPSPCMIGILSWCRVVPSLVQQEEQEGSRAFGLQEGTSRAFGPPAAIGVVFHFTILHLH